MPPASATIDFSAPKDGFNNITCVVTTGRYVPFYIQCSLFSSNLTGLGRVYENQPSDTTTTISFKGRDSKLSAAYSFGSAMIFVGGLYIHEATPLALLNPSPPPLGPSPPPPIFGNIDGSVTKNGNDFSFSLKFVDNPPEGVNYAFFSAAGGLVLASTQAYQSHLMTWTKTLTSATTALASYAQAVAYRSDVGTSSTLTLRWES